MFEYYDKLLHFLRTKYYCFLSGYDGIPIESMQGLDINSENIYNENHQILHQTPINADQHYSYESPNSGNTAAVSPNTGSTDFSSSSGNGNSLYSTVHNTPRHQRNLPSPPQAPNDNSGQVAAWYDTDL